MMKSFLMKTTAGSRPGSAQREGNETLTTLDADG